MQKSAIVRISLETKTICCDRSKDGLGEPAVYFIISNNIIHNCFGVILKKKRVELNV